MAQSREEYNAYLNGYMKKRYFKRKAWAQELLGGECARCGSTEELEFDHVDPTEKAFAIGSKLVSVAQAKLETELAKCQLLCKPCHLEKSREQGAFARYGAVV